MRSLIYTKKAIVGYILFVMLFIAPFITSYVGVASSFDEFVAIACIIFLFLRTLRNCNKFYIRIIYSLISIVLLGLLSTAIYHIAPSWKIAFYDLLVFVKPFVLFLYFYQLPDISKKEILSLLKPIAKTVYLFLLFVFTIDAFTNSFVLSNIIPIFSNMAQLSWLRVTCLVILVSSENEKKINYYLAIFYIEFLISGVSGFGSALFASMTIFLYLNRSNKERKFKTWQILLLAIASFIFAYQDLSEYIFNQYAPRAVLLRYGFVTANSHFPIGSGFASYGSEMAKRYYSSLYYQYGFDNVWSLSYKNSLPGGYSTLNDVYLGMIVGQFGYIGLICYGFILFCIYKLIQKSSCTPKGKAVLLSTLVTIISTVFISANSTSHFGIMLYAVMGLACFSLKGSEII